MTNNPHHTGVFASSTVGGVWWFLDTLYRLGPSWPVVPPLLFAVASLVGAVRGLLNDRQARRHAEEVHQFNLQTAARAAKNGASRNGSP